MFWRFKQFFPDKFWHIHCYFSFFESSILHFSSSLSRFKGAEKRSVLLITPFKCALFVFLFTKKCKKNDIYYCPKSYNAIPANSVHPPRWPITKGSVPGHKKCSGPHNLYIVQHRESIEVEEYMNINGHPYSSPSMIPTSPECTFWVGIDSVFPTFHCQLLHVASEAQRCSDILVRVL